MCNPSANAAHRGFKHSPKGPPLIASHVSLLAGLASGLAAAVEFSLSLFGRSHGTRFVYSDFSARPLILSVKELEESLGGRMMVSEHLKLNFPFPLMGLESAIRDLDESCIWNEPIERCRSVFGTPPVEGPACPGRPGRAEKHHKRPRRHEA
jgi:hypothetical protein